MVDSQEDDGVGCRMAVTHRDIGRWVLLKGKTRHGKNRIQQHGMEWLIENVSTFQGQPAMFLRSKNKTEGERKTTRVLTVVG